MAIGYSVPPWQLHDAAYDMSHFSGLFILWCWALFFLFIALSAFSVKRTVEIARGWKWSWLAMIPLAAALLFRGHVRLWPAGALGMTLWRRTPGVGAVAALLALLGLVMALWGRIALGRNWNIHPGLKENHEFIERGPYACVRHPMYSGLCLMLLGTVIWFGNGAGFIFFLACFLGTWWKLRAEEKLLTKQFGEGYLQYKARVKALIPFVL